MTVVDTLKRFFLRSKYKEQDEMWRRLSSTEQPIKFPNTNGPYGTFNDIGSLYPTVMNAVDEQLDELAKQMAVPSKLMK